MGYWLATYSSLYEMIIEILGTAQRLLLLDRALDLELDHCLPVVELVGVIHGECFLFLI